MFDAPTMDGIGVLVAVSEAGNFARAGEALGLTPSGVSRAVARLEARVGVRLFDRSPRSVSPTEEGARFLARVRPLVDSLGDAVAELSGTAGVATGRLRASIDPWVARMALAPALPGFLAAHPQLSVECGVTNHREEMMVGVDVAVRFGPPDVSSLIARKLADVPVVTLASPAYLAAHGTPLRPEDMARHEGILFRDPQTGRPFAWEFERGGMPLAINVSGRLTTDDPSLAVDACVAGQGVFQSLAIGLEPWIDAGRLVPVLTAFSCETWPLYAYHASRNRPPAKVRAFIDFVHEVSLARYRIVQQG